MNTPNEREWSPRPLGKTTRAFMRFFVEGMAGKAVVYATIKGKFLSPKAVENALAESRHLARKELLEEVEGIVESLQTEFPSYESDDYDAGAKAIKLIVLARLKYLKDANSSVDYGRSGINHKRSRITL